MGELPYAYKIVVGKPDGMGHFRRNIPIRYDNIKMGLQNRL